MNNDLLKEAKALFDAALQRHMQDREIRHDGATVFSVSVFVAHCGASTFDDAMLTRFVFECHERRWRGAVDHDGHALANVEVREAVRRLLAELRDTEAQLAAKGRADRIFAALNQEDDE